MGEFRMLGFLGKVAVILADRLAIVVARWSMTCRTGVYVS